MLFQRGMNKMVAGERGLPLLPSDPLVSLLLFWAARASRSQNFLLFSSLPFSQLFSLSPSSPFTPPYLPLPPPHFPPPSYPVHLLMNKLPKGYCTKSLQLNKKINTIIVFYGLLCANILNHIRLLYSLFTTPRKYDYLRYFVFLWRSRD